MKNLIKNVSFVVAVSYMLLNSFIRCYIILSRKIRSYTEVCIDLNSTKTEMNPKTINANFHLTTI